MSADNVKNFCKVEVSGYYGTSETLITLKTGEGTKLPTPPFNLVWWNATDYQDPTDDPYREIVRITAVNGDILTVSRGQENTTAQPHNISGKLYKMIRALTAKDFDDLQKIDVYKDGNLIGSRSKIDFKGGEVSDDSLNDKVNVFLTGNFATRATNPPSLQLYVSKGQVNISGAYVLFSGGNSPSFTIPTNYPRIDLLCLNPSGNLEIVQGTESANPSAPSYPSNKFVICEVYNRSNETCIKDSNDNTNGYIYKDVRAFLGSLKLGGDGSDGALEISSGTTTIDLNNQEFVVKNYTRISITGTGKLAFSNPHNKGTVIVLKSQGDVIITSNAPAIDASGMGSAPGYKGNALMAFTNYGGNAGASVGIGGVGLGFPINNLIGKIIKYANGAAGGSGGRGASNEPGKGGGGGGNMFSGGNGGNKGLSTGGNDSSNGGGGRGGGTLIIECGGSLNFTGTISVAGQNGQNGASDKYNGGGGGGGGAGGTCVIIYNFLTANTGTVNVSGGNGGNGGNGYPGTGGSGGAGGTTGDGQNGGAGSDHGGGGGGGGSAGQYLIAKNTEFF